MRIGPCLALLLSLAVLLVYTSPGLAEDGGPAAAASGTTDAALAEALQAAGTNRPELQRVLDHFPAAADAEKHAAARFLISNMPGKGYIITVLKDAKGQVVPYDSLAYPNFKASQTALEALEKQHGTLEFDRDRKVPDLEAIKAEFLIQHIDASFKAWRGASDARRISFKAFLDYVLPYRGSQEPLGAWLAPLRARYTKLAADLEAEDGAAVDVRTLWERMNKDVNQRVRFNERWYLHPTDQGFGEMIESGEGRCEDITNMQTFAARSMALATAADYTPYWGHRDNNHAWNVLLDAEGKGFAKGNAHAAKVYRKTFRIQRDNLPFMLPEGREAPNRFMASTNAVDVTAQYAETTDVHVKLNAVPLGAEGFAYLCVFNGGVWKAIQWARIESGHATFKQMGRNLCYLPAVHDGKRLIPIAAPRIVHRNGLVQVLAGHGGASAVHLTADRPRQRSVDTGVVTPVSHLKPKQTYILRRWTGTGEDGWVDVLRQAAGPAAIRVPDLPQDGLYWLVQKESRRLERIFTIERGLQKFW